MDGKFLLHEGTPFPKETGVSEVKIKNGKWERNTMCSFSFIPR